MNDAEKTTSSGILELCIDIDYVSIPVTRFEGLLAAETRLDVIKQGYMAAKYSSDVEDLCRIFFGPKVKEEGNDHA